MLLLLRCSGCRLCLMLSSLYLRVELCLMVDIVMLLLGRVLRKSTRHAHNFCRQSASRPFLSLLDRIGLYSTFNTIQKGWGGGVCGWGEATGKSIPLTVEKAMPDMLHGGLLRKRWRVHARAIVRSGRWWHGENLR